MDLFYREVRAKNQAYPLSKFREDRRGWGGMQVDRSEPTSPTSRNCVASEISKLLPPLGRIFRFLISTGCFQFFRLVPTRSGGGNEMREKDGR